MNPEEACALDARLGNRSVLIYPRSAPEVPLWLKGQLFLYIFLVNVWLDDDDDDNDDGHYYY